MDDTEFRQHAFTFLINELRYFESSEPANFEYVALNYVKDPKNKFKYRDPVEAGVLVDILVKEGYIEFVKKEYNIRYHTLTNLGLERIRKSGN